MKIAAAYAIAELAREAVPEEVAAAYGGQLASFGQDYIIPAPFDPRLMEVVPAAVAQAAMDSGVAQVGKDLLDDRPVGDRRDDPRAAAAMFAVQNVEGEGSLQELGPRHG